MSGMVMENAHHAAYRHEWKYFLHQKDAYILAQRLSSVMDGDANGIDGAYAVTSLYFDNAYMESYQEKVNGVSEREKFRIRIYNYATDVIRLERKRRSSHYIKKESIPISLDDYHRIRDGGLHCLMPQFHGRNPAWDSFFLEYKVNGLRPIVYVDYQRRVFTGPGGLRISFDHDLRVAAASADFFRPGNAYLPVMQADTMILEVKYTHYLPAHICAILNSVEAQSASVSKYVLCVDKALEAKQYV